MARRDPVTGVHHAFSNSDGNPYAAEEDQGRSEIGGHSEPVATPTTRITSTTAVVKGMRRRNRAAVPAGRGAGVLAGGTFAVSGMTASASPRTLCGPSPGPTCA